MTEKAERRVGERRDSAARQWREVRGVVRSETGARADSPAWWVAVLGVALGLEIARRVLGPKQKGE